MYFQPMNCKHSQGAADVRRRAHRRTFVLQVLGNKADAAPCECLRKKNALFKRYNRPLKAIIDVYSFFRI